MYYRLKAEYKNDTEGRKIVGQRVKIKEATYHPNAIVTVIRDNIVNEWYIKAPYLEPYNDSEFWDGNAWVKHKFLVDEAYIIGRSLEGSDKLIMASSPKIHKDYNVASLEAARLSDRFKGDSFVIFKGIATFKQKKLHKYKNGDQIRIIGPIAHFKVGTIATVSDSYTDTVRIYGVNMCGKFDGAVVSPNGIWDEPFPLQDVPF